MSLLLMLMLASLAGGCDPSTRATFTLPDCDERALWATIQSHVQQIRTRSDSVQYERIDTGLFFTQRFESIDDFEAGRIREILHAGKWVFGWPVMLDIELMRRPPRYTLSVHLWRKQGMFGLSSTTFTSRQDAFAERLFEAIRTRMTSHAGD
jgi:hypothetical protein